MDRKVSEKTLAKRIELCRRLNFECEPTKALGEAQEIMALVQEGEPTKFLAAAYQECALAQMRLGNSGDALQTIHSAIRIATELGDDYNLAEARAVYAHILMDLGLSDEADAEATEATRLAKKSKNTNAILRSLDIQAIVMIMAERFDMADRFLNEATRIIGGDLENPFYALILMHQGLVQSRYGDAKREKDEFDVDAEIYNKAIELTERSVEVSRINKDRRTNRVAICNLAEYYVVMGNTELAEKRLKEWHDIPGEKLNGHHLHFHYTMSEFLNRAGRPKEALDAGLMGLEIAERTSGADNLMGVIRRVVEAYESMGDYKAALDYHKRLHLLFKTIVGERAQLRVQIAEISHETEKVRRLLDLANRRATRLAEEALRDPLTGLANRRALDRELAHLDRESASSYALAIIDLDHFKLINDKFSHLVGDDVLRLVSEVMKKSCRQEDLVARMGGEEFVILMPDVNQEIALRVCERIREAIRANGWDSLAMNLKVSVSVGLALSDEGLSPLDVFALADARLYTAKADGRDRVEWRAMGGTDLSAVVH